MIQLLLFLKWNLQTYDKLSEYKLDVYLEGASQILTGRQEKVYEKDRKYV